LTFSNEPIRLVNNYLEPTVNAIEIEEQQLRVHGETDWSLDVINYGIVIAYPC
jgi:hypothetical protein